MKLTASWSDLLIEKGTRDPLGLWRVGDRMISELLGPFTTVVMFTFMFQIRIHFLLRHF